MSEGQRRDYKREKALQRLRGETDAGPNSGDALRHKARRRKEKAIGRKLNPDEVVHHKRAIKSGGSNNTNNLSVTNRSANAADGGRKGNASKKGKTKKNVKTRGVLTNVG